MQKNNEGDSGRNLTKYRCLDIMALQEWIYSFCDPVLVSKVGCDVLAQRWKEEFKEGDAVMGKSVSENSAEGSTERNHVESNRLPSGRELIENGYPYGMAVEGIPFGDCNVEYLRTNPDIIVFQPVGDRKYDNDNEHFLVIESPDKQGLLAFWTQSSCEGWGDNHLVMARSSNGEDWSAPKRIAGKADDGSGKQASWGFPVVNNQGRIYCFYTKEDNYDDTDRNGSGKMGCIYSDDCGSTWSEEGIVPMSRFKYDNPDPAVDKCWIVWQNVIHDNQGKPLAFCTQLTSKTVTPPICGEGSWVNRDSRCYLLRYENLDDNPEAEDIQVTWLPDEEGITVPHALYPHISVAQEPSCVRLPGGELFVVMRTMTGFIYYSVSYDNGVTWKKPSVLFMEDGAPFEHPLSPCPVYALQDGRFIILFHNNMGKKGRFDQFRQFWDCNYANYLRNPMYLCVGEYCEGADQPIKFGSPKKLLDTDDIAVGPKETAETGTYPSLTEWKGKRVLWYPDRKYYLLGKVLTDAFLEE